MQKLFHPRLIDKATQFHNGITNWISTCFPNKSLDASDKNIPLNSSIPQDISTCFTFACEPQLIHPPLLLTHPAPPSFVPPLLVNHIDKHNDFYVTDNE